jgi:hypothetical protein
MAIESLGATELAGAGVVAWRGSRSESMCLRCSMRKYARLKWSGTGLQRSAAQRGRRPPSDATPKRGARLHFYSNRRKIACLAGMVPVNGASLGTGQTASVTGHTNHTVHRHTGLVAHWRKLKGLSHQILTEAQFWNRRADRCR